MGGVIDSNEWGAKRLEYLRSVLAAEPAHEHRAAIEAEIAALEAEQKKGKSRRRWWLLFGGRLPS